MSNKNHLVSFDMTQGKIISQLIAFAWPLFVGNIFQQLYNIVNSIIVGNFLGSTALAAIGVFNPVYNLLLGLFQGIATGATVIVSQSFGARDNERLSQSVYISILFTMITGVLITAIGLGISSSLLHLIHTPPEIFDMALDYSRVMFLGVLPLLMFNILSGILRGMGDSIKPLFFLVIANIVNIFLDYLFVITLKIGIIGAGYATLIAQTVAAVCAFIYLQKSYDKYNISLKGLSPDWKLGKTLIKIGLPTGMQSSIFSIGFLLQQNLINSFGPVIMASYVIVTRLDQLATLPMNSFSVAITTFVGQNIGAKKMERAEEGTAKVFWVSQIMTIFITILLFTFGSTVIGWFTPESAVAATGSEILRMLCIGYIIINAYIILSGAIRGVGDTMAPLIVSLLFNVILRVGLAYTLVSFTHDWHSIFHSIIIAWTACSSFIAIYYKKGFWKRHIMHF